MVKQLTSGAFVIALLAVAAVMAVVAFEHTQAEPPHGRSHYTPPPTPVEQTPLRVAFIGDSYTVGAGSTNGGFFYDLTKAEGWDSIDLGAGGTGYLTVRKQDPKQAQTACARDYCPSYPEQIRGAVRFHPDVVIVSGGRNNTPSSVADLRRGIPAFYKQLRQGLPHAQIWVTSPLWDDDPAPAVLGTIAGLVKSSVAAVHGTYLDLGQPLRGHPEWISDDGVHPNDKGYAAITRAIEARLPKTAG